MLCLRHRREPSPPAAPGGRPSMHLSSRSLSSFSLPHPTSIDSRFVRAVSPDDSAVAPLAPSLLPLQEETGGGGGRRYMDATRITARGLCGAGRTGQASAGGIGRNLAPTAPGHICDALNG